MGEQCNIVSIHIAYVPKIMIVERLHVSRRNPRVRNVCCATKSESMRNLVSYILSTGGAYTRGSYDTEQNQSRISSQSLLPNP